MKKLTKDSIVTRTKDIVFGEVEGETVMMDIEKGTYFGLNSVASRIWELIDQPLTIHEICQRLIEEYDIKPDKCEKEVITFLNKLSEDNLLATP